MINERYANAYTEVLEIISHFSSKEYQKIPSDKIVFFEQNKNNNYEFKINPNQELDKQNISKEANAILVNLYLNYFATEEEKIKIHEILDLNQKKKELEKRLKYNPDNIFESKNTNIIKEENMENNTSYTDLIEQKEGFFTKFKNFIMKLFHISK